MKQELKFKEILKKSAEDIEEEDLQYKVEQAELSVRSVISETKKSLSQCRKRKNEILRAEEFDYYKYSEVEEEELSYKAGLEKAEKFLEERF